MGLLRAGWLWVYFLKPDLLEKKRFKIIFYSKKDEVFKSSEQSEFCV